MSRLTKLVYLFFNVKLVHDQQKPIEDTRDKVVISVKPSRGTSRWPLWCVLMSLLEDNHNCTKDCTREWSWIKVHANVIHLGETEEQLWIQSVWQYISKTLVSLYNDMHHSQSFVRLSWTVLLARSMIWFILRNKHSHKLLRHVCHTRHSCRTEHRLACQGMQICPEAAAKPPLQWQGIKFFIYICLQIRIMC